MSCHFELTHTKKSSETESDEKNKINIEPTYQTWVITVVCGSVCNAEFEDPLKSNMCLALQFVHVCVVSTHKLPHK